jgi:hypothetical protein
VDIEVVDEAIMGLDDARGRGEPLSVRRRRDWDDEGPPRPQRSGLITWLGIFNLVVGGFVLVGGLCGLLMINAFGSEGGKLGGLGLPGLGGGAALSLLTVAAVSFWGTGAIVSGIGILCRAGWSRIAMLLLGGCAGAVGFLYLVAAVLWMFSRDAAQSEGQVVAVLISLGGALLFLGHCTWCYGTLLQDRYAREFR